MLHTKELNRRRQSLWFLILLSVIAVCGSVWGQSHIVSRQTSYGTVQVAASDPDLAAKTADDFEAAKSDLIIWGSIPSVKNAKSIGDFTWNQTAIITVFSSQLPLTGVFESRWYAPDNRLYRTTLEPFHFDSAPGPKTVSTSLTFPSPTTENPPQEGVWRVDLLIDGQQISTQQIRFYDTEKTQ